MEPITNAQYNRLVDSLTIPQLDELQAMMLRIGRTLANFKSFYEIIRSVDIETFLQIAYAAIVVCGFSLECEQ